MYISNLDVFPLPLRVKLHTFVLVKSWNKLVLKTMCIDKVLLKLFNFFFFLNVTYSEFKIDNFYMRVIYVCWIRKGKKRRGFWIFVNRFFFFNWYICLRHVSFFFTPKKEGITKMILKNVKLYSKLYLVSFVFPALCNMEDSSIRFSCYRASYEHARKNDEMNIFVFFKRILLFKIRLFL